MFERATLSCWLRNLELRKKVLNTVRTFDPHEILHDDYLRSSSQFFDVHDFLKEIGSPLADLNFEGLSVAQILTKVSGQTSIDVRVLLTWLEVSQQLLSGDVSPEKLDWAMKYGLTEKGPLTEFRGFTIQVTLLARTLAGFLREGHPLTVVGQVEEPMDVKDGRVFPKNQATAALYRVMPWIGLLPCESWRAPSGTYGFFLTWWKLFACDPREPLGPQNRSDTSSGRPSGQAVINLVFLVDGEEPAQILVDHHAPRFSGREQEVLRKLAFAQGRFLSDDELQNHVVMDIDATYRTISRIRKKIGSGHLVRHRCSRTAKKGYRLLYARVSIVDIEDLPPSVTDIVTLAYQISKSLPESPRFSRNLPLNGHGPEFSRRLTS